MCIVVVTLAIQLLPLHQTNDYLYDDDSHETCISVFTNDGADFSDVISIFSLALDQQIICFNNLNFNCKIFPGFPVCIYSDCFIDTSTPPPDNLNANLCKDTTDSAVVFASSLNFFS